MSTLKRYVQQEISLSTGLVLLAFLSLLMFLDLIYEMGSVGKGNYHFADALLFVLLSAPGHVYELLPICALIGGIYALSTLAVHSEITAMRSSGLSILRFGEIVLEVGIGLVFVTLLFGEGIIPYTEQWAQEVRSETQNKKNATKRSSDIWLRDRENFIHIGSVSPDQLWGDIKMYTFDSQGRLSILRRAKRGSFIPPRTWELEEIESTQFTYSEDTQQSKRTFEERVTLEIDINREALKIVPIQPEKMSLYSLYYYIDYLSNNHQKTVRYELALWHKIIYPLASMIMLFLSLPFAYLSYRSTSIAPSVSAGIGLGIGFHLLNNLFASLGVFSTWHPMLVSLTPSLLFAVVSIVWVWRMNRV